MELSWNFVSNFFAFTRAMRFTLVVRSVSQPKKTFFNNAYNYGSTDEFVLTTCVGKFSSWISNYYWDVRSPIRCTYSHVSLDPQRVEMVGLCYFTRNQITGAENERNIYYQWMELSFRDWNANVNTELLICETLKDFCEIQFLLSLRPKLKSKLLNCCSTLVQLEHRTKQDRWDSESWNISFDPRFAHTPVKKVTVSVEFDWNDYQIKETHS